MNGTPAVPLRQGEDVPRHTKPPPTVTLQGAPPWGGEGVQLAQDSDGERKVPPVRRQPPATTIVHSTPSKPRKQDEVLAGALINGSGRARAVLEAAIVNVDTVQYGNHLVHSVAQLFQRNRGLVGSKRV